jgi:hypothetical protein
VARAQLSMLKRLEREQKSDRDDIDKNRAILDNLKASYVTNKAEVDRAITDANRKIEEQSLTLR